MTAATTLAPGRHAVFHSLPVSQVRRLTSDSVVVTFEVPADLREAYRFAPGQHVTVRSDLGGTGVRRNYSICEPVTSGRLSIGVKRIEGGVFSSYALERLAPGDELEVMTPTGRFSPVLDPARGRHCAAVAAGSGITPIMSIVASVLAVEPLSRCTLLYGNRTTDSVMFLEELADLKNRYPDRFALYHFLSRETQETPLADGRLDRAKLTLLLTTILPPSDVGEWFLCGPPQMVDGTRATLVDHGVDQRRIHRELFHADAVPRPVTPASPRRAGSSAVRITLGGRQTRLELAPDGEPVLDAVLRARPDAPYACRGGVCGTCRAKLIEGTVRMDQNYALESDETDLGYVLTCQSHPTSPRVVLDYDA